MLVIILLVILAAGLMIAETVLPGGVAGVLGVLSLGGAVAMTYSNYGAPVGHYVLAGLVFVFGFGGLLWLNYFPQSNLGKRLWFQGPDIGTSSPNPPLHLVGKSGVTESPLRPTGIAIIDGERFDVIAQGEFVERKSTVEVTRVEGNKIEVRAGNGDGPS